MGRWMATIALACGGCTTAPQAQVADYLSPSRNACAACATCDPCAAGKRPPETPRPGLFDRLFHPNRSKEPEPTTPMFAEPWTPPQ